MKPPVFKDLEFPFLPFLVLAMSFVILLFSFSPYVAPLDDTPLLAPKQPQNPPVQPSDNTPPDSDIYCGTAAYIQCPGGYDCIIDPASLDGLGFCQPSTPESTLTCPQGQWVDCMPGPDKPANPQCQKEYLDWAQANCPGFEGAAL